jgi:hypothetical protein
MMDVKKATTLASIVMLAFMLTAGFFVQVCYTRLFKGANWAHSSHIKLLTLLNEYFSSPLSGQDT